MQVDLLLNSFGVTWGEVREAAIAADGEGFDGIWLNDHLAGTVHGEPWVLECWTTLTAIAALVPRLSIGPMVLNVANRDPGTLAVMAATLQAVSGGRLLLGLGAGGGRNTPYAAEQLALGRSVPGDQRRREAVETTIARLRSVWSGTITDVSGTDVSGTDVSGTDVSGTDVSGTDVSGGDVGGFLRPDPAPPILVAGFGPKMARLAGRMADGINLPGGPQLAGLVEAARASRRESGYDPTSFVVSVSSDIRPASLERLGSLGVDRAVVYVSSPSAGQVRRLAAARSR